MKPTRVEGRITLIEGMLSEVVHDFNRLWNNTETASPEVHIVHSWGSVPLGVAGDGIYGLARLAFELAMEPGSLALIEEPESNQHPRSLRMSARVIWAAVRQGVQVVLSTHSLELIDMLLDGCYRDGDGDDLAQLAVCRLRLSDGNLMSIWHRGDEIRSARTDIEEDIR
jgi:AAA15 family ATPase/GTPase